MIFAFFHNIKSSLAIRLMTLIAILGLGLVVFSVVFMPLGTGKLAYTLVPGFVMMFLGTLWKAVFEMNQEDE